MNSITINQFTNDLKITNQDGASFVVISTEYWEQQQETLAILQNNNPMEQIVN